MKKLLVLMIMATSVSAAYADGHGGKKAQSTPAAKASEHAGEALKKKVKPVTEHAGQSMTKKPTSEHGGAPAKKKGDEHAGTPMK